MALFFVVDPCRILDSYPKMSPNHAMAGACIASHPLIYLVLVQLDGISLSLAPSLSCRVHSVFHALPCTCTCTCTYLLPSNQHNNMQHNTATTADDEIVFHSRRPSILHGTQRSDFDEKGQPRPPLLVPDSYKTTT
jgi:hypothetical protein